MAVLEGDAAIYSTGDDVPPQQDFEGIFVKDSATTKRWGSLPSQFRRLINLTFNEVLLGGQFRERVTSAGPFWTQGGVRVDRFIMDMQFGLLVFGYVEARSRFALIDFHVDEFAMAMALRCNPQVH
jgi:hypothetical protein